MKKAILGFGMVLVMLAGGVEAFDVFLPPAGEDVLPTTEAELEVQIGASPEPMTIGCSGPTVIRRGDPQGGVIQTEMVSLDLSCSEGVRVRLAREPKSLGQIQANGDSFFDVFVEIETPQGILRNQEAARVQATIAHIPPLGAIYFGVHPVPLFGSGPVAQAQLVHVKHKTDGVPKPESSGEFSRVFSCFYECKQDPAGKNWLELTTLMLVNQSAKQPLTANILFVNGNEKPIAKTTTDLSPLDLDELNVCETLNQSTAAVGVVPPAGIIEVVLSPTGGAYGWVKNLTGRFTKSIAEPDFMKVTGVAKTECRVVGPNAARPEEILNKLAPNINPILVERTNP